MNEITKGVVMFEAIGNDARLTVRVYREDKSREEFIFPPETSVNFKAGVLSADKDPIG